MKDKKNWHRFSAQEKHGVFIKMEADDSIPAHISKYFYTQQKTNIHYAHQVWFQHLCPFPELMTG